MKTEIILVKRPKIKTQKPREKSLLPDILSVANFKIKNKKQALKTKMKKKKTFFPDSLSVAIFNSYTVISWQHFLLLSLDHKKHIQT